MKQIVSLIIILAAVLLLAACEALPPGEYDVIPRDGQVVTPGVHRYDSPNGDYTFHLGQAVDASQTPTNTPAPSPTLTPPPTNTPRPTATAIPATEIPGEEPTPTQEATPLPRCVGTVTASAVNVRADHDTAAAKLGSLTSGELVYPVELWISQSGP